MDDIVRLFSQIYSQAGFVGIIAALFVGCVCILFVIISYSIIAPMVIKRFKGDSYVSWQTISDRVSKLEAYADVCRKQREAIFFKIDKLEEKK